MGGIRSAPGEKEMTEFGRQRNRGAWGIREMNGKRNKILRVDAINYFPPL